MLPTSPRRVIAQALAVAAAVAAAGQLRAQAAPPEPTSPAAVRFEVTYDEGLAAAPLDGRLLLLLSTAPEGEPRHQINTGPNSQQVFGLDVEGWRAGEPIAFPDTAFGYPVRRLAQLKPGTYRVQALLNRYETHRLADGRVLSLPPDMGEGQRWSAKPGNLLSRPVPVAVGAGSGDVVRIRLTEAIPPLPQPPDTEWVKHVRIRSERLSAFWGRDVHLGAWVLIPAGFHENPDARYPLAVFHDHFPYQFVWLRTEPPDPDLPCEYSARFRLDCFNRIVQEQTHQLYRDWTSPDFPRMLVVQVQHANPYYDDSYGVNSANLGPYGDAITYELIPEIERRFRGIGEGRARFLYGGSTGGWTALATQIFYPDEYNGVFASCPDPIDFRAFGVVDLYQDSNVYWLDGPWKRVARPGARDWLGRVTATVEDMNHMELALGTRTRSGRQYDAWEAVFSPVGPDGYPARIFDKVSGRIDRRVAEYWREHYDLGHILRRDWATLGAKLAGKIHIYVGDMDNYYLNNAVYLVEEFLEGASPRYEGVVDYGDRAEHCWNGDHERPIGVSTFRYVQMYVGRMGERMRAVGKGR